MEIQELVSAQRAFFRTGATRELSFRKEALAKLKGAIQAREGELLAALRADLGKSDAEGYLCEVGLTLAELSFAERHLARWARERRVGTPLALFPARSTLITEPYGVALIMSPWNYSSGPSPPGTAAWSSPRPTPPPSRRPSGS